MDKLHSYAWVKSSLLLEKCFLRMAVHVGHYVCPVSLEGSLVFFLCAPEK